MAPLQMAGINGGELYYKTNAQVKRRSIIYQSAGYAIRAGLTSIACHCILLPYSNCILLIILPMPST